MVKALPIGIPYQRFEALAKKAPRAFGAEKKVIKHQLSRNVVKADSEHLVQNSTRKITD